MEQTKYDEHSLGRANGLAIREATLRGIAKDSIAAALSALGVDNPALRLHGLLDTPAVRSIMKDLAGDLGWSRERWILTETNEVIPVSDDQFEAAPAKLRFSNNECLRKPAIDAWALRGFLSAIASEHTAESLSGAVGFPVKLASVDIARYVTGDYLVRHSDTFEDRCFGFVWFFNDGWQPGFGGELHVETPSGETVSISPIAGETAVLAIRPGCYHQVTRIQSRSWIRYSIATHFRRVSQDPPNPVKPSFIRI